MERSTYIMFRGELELEAKTLISESIQHGQDIILAIVLRV